MSSAGGKKAATASGPSLTQSILKLTIPAGQATAGAPIGPALGQKGIKAIDFVKQFNEISKPFLTGTPMRVIMKCMPDRTFTFQMRPPATSWWLKKACGLEIAANQPGRQTVAKVDGRIVYEIAKLKRECDPHLKSMRLRSVFSMVAHQARCFGIKLK